MVDRQFFISHDIQSLSPFLQLPACVDIRKPTWLKDRACRVCRLRIASAYFAQGICPCRSDPPLRRIPWAPRF
jgi:hypothetical protein